MCVLNDVTECLRQQRFLPVRILGGIGFAVGVYETPSGPMIVVETPKSIIYAGPDEIGPVQARLE